jgi:hypothetical protein
MRLPALGIRSRAGHYDFYRTGLVVIAVPIRAELDDSSVKRNADPPAHANDHSLALEGRDAMALYQDNRIA